MPELLNKIYFVEVNWAVRKAGGVLEDEAGDLGDIKLDKSVS